MPLVIPPSAEWPVKGRLTLTTAVPVTTADVTGATTIYYTPYLGNVIRIGSIYYTFAEISIALGTLSTLTLYDVFAYDVAGAVTLKLGPAWTSGTGRGTGAGTTELVRTNGVLVNAVAITSGPAAGAGLYLGTFKTTSTTATEDSGGGVTTQTGGKRFLFNNYNRVPRHLNVFDSTDQWTYSSATIRQANAAAGNKVEFVDGVGDLSFNGSLTGSLYSAANGSGGVAAFGVDSTTTMVVGMGNATMFQFFSTAAITLPLGASYRGIPGLGYHYMSWNEHGTGTAGSEFGGDFNNAGVQSGIVSTIVL